MLCPPFHRADAYFGPMEEYTLGPVARYCSAWQTPILTPGGMVVAFDDKQDYLEGYTTLTRMLGGYMHLGHALHGILEKFQWRTAYVVYQSSDNHMVGHSDCQFRVDTILPFLERTDMQDDLIERFDEMRWTRSEYRSMMERAKRNARRKSGKRHL